MLLTAPWQLAVAAVALAAVFALARIPAGLAAAQLWPMRWFLLFVAVFQVIFTGWERAVMVCGSLLLTVAIAAVVTLTTRVTEMLDVCQRLLRPLRRFGVDPDRAGLVLALTIRCDPAAGRHRSRGVRGEKGPRRRVFATGDGRARRRPGAAQRRCDG